MSGLTDEYPLDSDHSERAESETADTYADASPDMLPVIYDRQMSAIDTVNLAIAAWLHAKFQRSRSVKTQSTYSAILQTFRALLLARGLDLTQRIPVMPLPALVSVFREMR